MPKHYSRLLTSAGLVLCAVLLTGLLSCSQLMQAYRPDGPDTSAIQQDDPAPPAETVKLIFIHHSCGENWLTDGNGDLGIALRDNNYFVSDTNYGWGGGIGDLTDIGHWWTWFRGPDSVTYTNALYDEFGQNSYYSRLSDPDPGRENQVIMFKSCYPNSYLGGSPGDIPPPIGSNPLRGQDVWSGYHTIANAKGIYIDLLNYFQDHPDKLFIAITAPPQVEGDTDPSHAANARAFNDWLVNDWLASYPHDNVAVWDFYNVLTSNGGYTYTNDLGEETGNHHRWWNGAVQHQQTVMSDVSAYASGSDNSHPTQAGNLKATGEFVQMLNVFYNRWDGGAPPGPTDTPNPTDTFGPTHTPSPTDTFGPTHTPGPTGSPGPTQVVNLPLLLKGEGGSAPTPTNTPFTGPTPSPTPHGGQQMAFQDGVSPDPSYDDTRDAVLARDEGREEVNLGGTVQLETFFGDEENRRTLVRWDVSAIPGGAAIQAATVELFRYDGDPVEPMNVALYRLTRTWTEGTGATYEPPFPPADGTTWISATLDTAWTTPGGDYDTSTDYGHGPNGIVDQITLPAGMGNRWIRLDATAVVQDWVDGSAPNFGLLLRPSGGEYTYHYYHSREAEVPTLRPRLVVTYTAGLQAAPQSLHLAPRLQPPQPAALTARHRQGQTFLTWSEVPAADHYRIYRHTAPIDAGNLTQAALLAELPQATGVYTRENMICASYETSPISQTRFVITDTASSGLGLELPAGTGLFVATSQAGGSYYYAITSLAGGSENQADFGTGNTAGPVAENPATIGATRVWENSTGSGAVYTHWQPYHAWNPDFEGYAYNFYVGVPLEYLTDTADYPLVIELHGWGDRYWVVNEDEYGGDGAPYDWPAIYVVPCDRCATWWYGFGDWLEDWGDPPPAGATVVNYTEQRLLAMIDFIRQAYRVDEERIYLYGSSMGGSGAMSFGLRHPEIFAAVYANAGMTNHGASDMWRSDFEDKWGPYAANLPTNEGLGVYDRMNTQARSAEWTNTPFMGWSHGTLDDVVEWDSQGQPAPAAFQAAGLGWDGVFDAYDHTWAGFLAADGYGWSGIQNNNYGFELFNFPKSESFPGLAGAGCSADPSTSPTGTVNLCLEWSSSVNDFAGPPLDTAGRYEITLRLRSGYGASTTVDVIPRRMQAFAVLPGSSYDWENRLGDDTLVDSGVVVADSRGLVTVADFQVGTAGNKLVLTPGGPITPTVYIYLPLVLKSPASSGPTPSPTPSPSVTSCPYTLTPTPSPSATPTPGAGRPWPDTSDGVHVFNDQLYLQGNSAWTQFSATHYDGTQKMTRSDADALRAVDPDFLILHYRLGIGLGYRAADSACQPTGGYLQIIEGDSWVQEWPGDGVVQPEWFFSYGGSDRVFNCDWGWYLMQVDNASWRSWWIGEIQRQLAANDDDGLFADSVSVPNYLGHDHWDPYLPAVDAAFEATWAQRIEDWMDYVRGQFAGQYVLIPNAGEWVTGRDPTDYGHADGIMIEGFGYDAWQAYGQADWELQMDRMLGLINQDKIILAQPYSNDTVDERMFSLGSYLLIKGTRTYLNLDHSMEPEWWPEYDIPIGSYSGGIPDNVGELYDSGWGVYRRDYSAGMVLVNPGSSGVTVNLGGTYYLAQPSGGGIVPNDGQIPPAWTVNYTPVTQVTLGAGTAAVLLDSAP